MSTPTTLYRLYAPHGRLLYVGITNSPTGRFTTHASERVWWDEIATISLEHFSRREEAERAEQAAIRSEEPLFNVAHNQANSTRQSTTFRPWALPRSSCAYCGRTQAVYPNGYIARHHTATRSDGIKVPYGRCPGSLRRPSEVSA